MADRSVVVRLRAEAGQYIATMGKAAAATRAAAGAAVESGAKHKQSFDLLGKGAIVAGGAMLLGFGMAARASMQFEKAMSGVKAVSNATSAEMALLSDAALQAGADTVFSASQAAQAEAELARAGVATADILGGALTGSLSLAAAGQLALGDAATISAQAMNIFKLEGSDVGHIADVLASGANKSAASVDDLGMALKQGGLVASQTGLSLEDTVGVLSAFADNALLGSDAGTSLKTMLMRLNPTSQEAKAAMESLGISAYDAAGNFVGLEAFAGNLQTSLSGLTVEQRNTALATIFGADATRAAGIVYDLGADGVRDYTSAVNDQGAASRMAATQLDNLAGDIEAFSGSLETALIKSGSQTNGVLREMVQLATAGVNAYSDLPAPIQSVATTLLGVGGAVLVVAGGFLLLLPRIRATQTAMVSLGVTMRGVVTAAGLLTGLLTVASAAFSAHTYTQNQNRESAEKLATAYRDGGSAAADAGTAIAAFNAMIEQGGDVGRLGQKALDDFNEALDEQTAAAGPAGNAQAQLSKAQRTYADLLETGTANSEQLAAAHDAVVAAGGRVKTVTDAVASATAGAVEPVVDLTEAQQALADALLGFVDPLGAYTDTLAVKEEKERATAEATASATESGADSWEDYAEDVDVSVGEYLRALEKMVAAQRDWQVNMMLLAGRVSSGVIEHLQSLGPEGAPLVAQLVDASDAELRRMERVFKGRTEAAVAAQQQVITEAGPVLAAVAAIAGEKTARGYARKLAAGTTTVAAIAKKYGIALEKNIPDKVETKIKADTAAATAKVLAFTSLMSRLDGSFATVALRAVQQIRPPQSVAEQRKHSGGMLPGSGEVPFIGLGGEGVVNRRGMSRLTPPGLAALNSGATLTPVPSGGQSTATVMAPPGPVELSASTIRRLAREIGSLRAYIAERDVVQAADYGMGRR